MANEEHLVIIKQGVEVWNQWRREDPDIIPDLRMVDFSGMDLSGANLEWADLRMAILVGANLSKTNFHGADLCWADLSGANLDRADLSWVDTRETVFRGANLHKASIINADLSELDLSNVDLSGADLSATNLSWVDLSQAKLSQADLSWVVLSGSILRDSDFSNVNLRNTLFANVDLSTVKGLETVRHQGPSTIGIDTLYKSQGKIPEIFLRGTGVPEELIAYLPSLITGKAIQYYSCFISYSSKDEEFVRRLCADLRARNVRVWFAEDDIRGGRKLHEQIPEAIRLYDKLLLVLSENSMQSEWVKTEIRHARKAEVKENRRKLFPISLVDYKKIEEWEAPDDSAKDMAVEVREYFIPDFSNWKEQDAYQTAFERLMRDLNLGEGV